MRFTTAEDFDFLLFEPMMAAVVLTLGYTADQMQDFPIDEEERMNIWRADEEGLRKVFLWLKRKGVTSIINLTVKENPRHYCSGHTVRHRLKDLEVRYLNWDRPDLCGNSVVLPQDLIEITLTQIRLVACAIYLD